MSLKTTINAGEQLLKLVRSATRTVFIVSPYIKSSAFIRLLEELQPSAELIVFTRWKEIDIIQGASDISVWLQVQKVNGSMFHNSRLHAKYYRMDKNILIGSANLTNSGMGWSNCPNLEVLTHPHCGFDIDIFEAELLQESVKISESQYKDYEYLEQMFLSHNRIIDENKAQDILNYRPRTSEFNLIQRAYTHGIDSLNLSSDSKELVSLDLSDLSIPIGLESKQCLLYIRTKISLCPFFNLVEQCQDSESFERTYEHVSSILNEDSIQLRNQIRNALYWLNFLPNVIE